MEKIITSFYKSFAGFSHSTAFSVIKFFLFIYFLVLLYCIILLLINRGVRGNLRQLTLGIDMPKELTCKRYKLRLRWMNLKKRLEGGDPDYKIMIIEADEIISELIKGLGYKGENLGERLENIQEGQLEYLAELKEAHQFRNRIIHDDSLQISREKAEEIMGQYEKFLNSFEVFG